jgi:hypothetical protein
MPHKTLVVTSTSSEVWEVLSYSQPWANTDAFIIYCSCLAIIDPAKRVPSHIPFLGFTEPALLEPYTGTSMVLYVKVHDVRYSYLGSSNHASVDGYGFEDSWRIVSASRGITSFSDTYFVIYG